MLGMSDIYSRMSDLSVIYKSRGMEAPLNNFDQNRFVAGAATLIFLGAAAMAHGVQLAAREIAVAGQIARRERRLRALHRAEIRKDVARARALDARDGLRRAALEYAARRGQVAG